MREVEKREEKCSRCKADMYCWGGKRFEELELLVELGTKTLGEGLEITAVDERILEMHRQLFEKSLVYRFAVFQLVQAVTVTLDSSGLGTAVMEMMEKLREMVYEIARIEALAWMVKGGKSGNSNRNS